MAVPEKKGRELLRLRRSLSRAEQAIADFEKSVLGPARLCSSDLEILDHLSRKGAKPVNSLAPRVGLTSGSMTTAVQRLIRRGLVETRRDQKDKRVVWVAVTVAGRELAKQTTDARTDALRSLLDDWTGRELTVLTALLKRLRKGSRPSQEEDGD